MTYRVLLVDPSKTIRLAAQMVFAKSPDILLSTALNSFEALDKMHLFKPSLVIMDEELARQLCSHLKRLPSPMVVLNKPFSSKGLAEQVQSALLSLAQQNQQESYGT